MSLCHIFMQNFIEYVAVSTDKKSSIINCVLPEKKSYWAVRMLHEGITPPLLPGYNMDVLSKFLQFIVFHTFNSLFGKVLLMAEENF